MHNYTSDGSNLFGKTLRGLRKKAGLTQEEMVHAAENRFKIDSLRKWEAGRDYLSLDSLKTLITFFLKRHTFAGGKEREEAKDLWEKAGQTFPRLSIVSFDENWFTRTWDEIRNSQTPDKQPNLQSDTNLPTRHFSEAIEVSSLTAPSDQATSAEPVQSSPITQPTNNPSIPSNTAQSAEALTSVNKSDSEIVKQKAQENINGQTLDSTLAIEKAYTANANTASILKNENTATGKFKLIPKTQLGFGILISISLVLIIAASLILSVFYANSSPESKSSVSTLPVTFQATSIPTSATPVTSKSPLFILKDLIKDDKFLTEAIYCMTFSANSKTLVSVSGNSKINFWRVNANGTVDKIPLKSLTGYQTGTKDRASWVVYSKDGKRLAVASGSRTSTGPQKWEIEVWQVDDNGLPKTEQPFQRINPDADHVPAFGFNSNGTIIASPGPNNSVVIWDVDSGKQLTALSEYSGQAREFSFNRDSSGLIVASGDGTVKLWNVKSGVLLKTFESHTGGAYTATLSPDEKLVASGGNDKVVNLSEVDTAKKLVQFTDKHQNGEVYSVTFSPNGKILATAGLDGDIILWDVATGEILQELKGNIVINNLAFTPDGKFLASGTDKPDNVIINLWQILDISKSK